MSAHAWWTTLDALARLKPLFGPEGTVTAGNASGINDGAAAMIVASAVAAERYGLTKRARILGMASAGVEPRVIGQRLAMVKINVRRKNVRLIGGE